MFGSRGHDWPATQSISLSCLPAKMRRCWSRHSYEGYSLSGESLDEDLHPTTETEDKMESRLFLDVVVRKRATVLELRSGEDETLLVRRNTLCTESGLSHNRKALPLRLVSRSSRYSSPGRTLTGKPITLEVEVQYKGKVWQDVDSF